MKLVCITQKPIQTLILIYLLAKYKIFFDKIFYFKKNPLQNFNTNQEGINSINALKYQCKIMRIKLIELTPKNQLKLIKYLPRKKNFMEFH